LIDRHIDCFAGESIGFSWWKVEIRPFGNSPKAVLFRTVKKVREHCLARQDMVAIPNVDQFLLQSTRSIVYEVFRFSSIAKITLMLFYGTSLELGVTQLA
jgi:hypothetical protein